MSGMNRLQVSGLRGNEQIQVSALLGYLTVALSILSSVIYVPWIIHNVGDSNYALYTLTMSIISFVMFDFGFGSAATRYIVKYLSEDDQVTANNVTGIAFRVYLSLDAGLVILFLILFFNIENIYRELTDLELEYFKHIFVIAAIYSLISFPFMFLNGVLSAYEKFIMLKFVNMLHRILIIILTFTALIMDYGIVSLVWINSSVGLLSIVLKLILLKRSTAFKMPIFYLNKDLTKRLLAFSTWVAIVLISQRMIFNLTPSILGIFSGSNQITLFGIASAIEGHFYMIASVINGLFLPKVMRSIKNNSSSSKNAVTPLMIKVGRIQLIIFLFLFGGFAMVGNEFIALWVGDEYSEVYLIILLLSLPSVLYLPQLIGNTAILAMNKVRLQGFVFVAMALTNVVLASLLSISWGALGAAISICIAYFLRSLGLNYIYSRVIGIDIQTFFLKTYRPMVVPLSIVIMICILLYAFIDPSVPTQHMFIIKGLIYASTYIAIFYKYVFNQQEKLMITSIYSNVKRLGRDNHV